MIQDNRVCISLNKLIGLVALITKEYAMMR